MGHVRLFLGSVKVVVDFNKNESTKIISYLFVIFAS